MMTEKPTEKLSMRRLADDIEALRKQVAALEKSVAQQKAAPAEKPKAKVAGSGKEITAEQRHALVETLAHFKAARRAQAGQVGDAESDWLEAEAEVALLLAALRANG
jgi:uncharacterized protein HemX